LLTASRNPTSVSDIDRDIVVGGDTSEVRWQMSPAGVVGAGLHD